MSQMSPFTDPEEILQRIKPVTDAIHLGLHTLLPVTRNWFEQNDVPVDKACHAMMTRLLLKHELLRKQIYVEDEEEREFDFQVQGLANCGLIITTSEYNLRVLKSRDGELPPSQSKQRRDFYQFNLFTLETDDPHPEVPIPPLNLVAAWETDQEHNLKSLAVVCPCGESGNRVVCRWGKTLALDLRDNQPLLVQEALPPEPALDEITLKQTIDLETEPVKTSGTRNGKVDRAT